MPSEAEYRPGIEFVISSVTLKPEIVETDAAIELWPLLQPLFDRLTSEEDKAEVTRTAILFASRSKDSDIASASKEFVLETWRTASDALPARRARICQVDRFNGISTAAKARGGTGARLYPERDSEADQPH